jgi:hypothetical protein
MEQHHFGWGEPQIGKEGQGSRAHHFRAVPTDSRAEGGCYRWAGTMIALVRMRYANHA